MGSWRLQGGLGGQCEYLGHGTQPLPISLKSPGQFPSPSTIWWRHSEKQKLTTGNHSKLPLFKPVGLTHNLLFTEVIHALQRPPLP